MDAMRPARLKDRGANESPSRALPEPRATRIVVDSGIDLVHARHGAENARMRWKTRHHFWRYTPGQPGDIIERELSVPWGKARNIENVESLDIPGFSRPARQAHQPIGRRAAARRRHQTHFGRLEPDEGTKEGMDDTHPLQVADKTPPEAFDPPEFPLNREQVNQRLGRMLVGT